MEDTPMICPDCGEEMFSAQQLTEHNRQMHGAPAGQPSSAGMGKRAASEMTCPACGATFASIDQLQAHQQQRHGNWA